MKRIFILITILCVSIYSWGQSPFDISINRLKTETQATVVVDHSLGNADFVRFPKENPLQLSGNTPIEKVNAFFDKYEGIFIPSNDASHWIEKESKTDPILQSQHITLLQHKNGIPVYGSELKFHFDEQTRLTSINGFVFPNIPNHSEPQLTEDRARELAISLTESKYSDISNAPLLIHNIELLHYREGTIQNKPLGKNHLVYHIEVTNKSNVREFIFLDAMTGKELESFSGMCNAMSRKLYDGNFNTLVWQEGDDFPGNLDEWRERQLIASEDAYNFFNNAFQYISFDGNDADMLIVHNPDNINCPNANWNGVSINFCVGVGSDDVVGHEWSHAYTQYTSGLIYQWQAGALNEAYSDIWGETIDLINDYDDDDEDLSLRTNCNDSDRWLQGEDAAAFGGAIRDMWNPNCMGDPGSVTDNQYHCNESDNGGVHINSGVINHSYVLLVDGGSFNNITIDSLGLIKTAHIYWRVQNTYLSPVSDFEIFANALEAACSDLVGVDLEGLSTDLPIGLTGEMISEMDCEAIANVIVALDLKTTPDCNFTTVLNNDPPDLECMESDTFFYEDFETGMDGWTTGAEPVSPSTWEFREWMIVDELPQDRPGSAIFVPNPLGGNCADDLENGIVRVESPSIDIPVMENTSFHLMFRHNIATEALWDGGNVKYSKNGGLSWNLVSPAAFTYNGYNDRINSAEDGNDNPMENQFAFTGTDGGTLLSTWGESHVKLSALGVGSGDSIIFRWELGEDGCNGRHGWYVDDVLMYTCFDDTPGLANENIISESEINISPNPFQNQISIEIKKEIQGEQAINIIDLSGKVVFSKQVRFNANTPVVLDELGYLPTGIYIINIQGEQAVYTGKVVRI